MVQETELELTYKSRYKEARCSVVQCAAVHDVQAVRGVLALIRTVQKYSCISTSVAVQHAAEVAVYQWQYISTAVTIQQQLTQHCCTAAALQLYIPHQ